jgi:hypothetical protein
MDIEFQILQIPLTNNEDVLEPISVAALGPHALMHTAWVMGERQFHMSLLGPDGASAVHDWWSNFSRCSWAADHPVGKDRRRTHDYKVYAVPLGHIGFSNRARLIVMCTCVVRIAFAPNDKHVSITSGCYRGSLRGCLCKPFELCICL